MGGLYVPILVVLLVITLSKSNAVFSPSRRSTDNTDELRRDLEEAIRISVSGVNNSLNIYNPQITVNPPASDLILQMERLSETYRQGQETTHRLLENLNTAGAEPSSESTKNQIDRLLEVVLNQPVMPPEMLAFQQETQLQLRELQSAVSGLADILRNLPKASTSGNSMPETEASNSENSMPETEASNSENSMPETATHFKDCSAALAGGVDTSGVYEIQPLDNGRSFKVFCDMDTDGGGWTVFQRRMDGSEDFYRTFAEYGQGFGDLDGEFWLGNDKLHRLTSQDDYELRIDLTDFADDSVYAVYDVFKIADVTDNYRLTVEGYSGTAGDSLSYHSGRQFSTKDRNNDICGGTNCPVFLHGAWWYCNCYHSNLNAAYLMAESPQYRGVGWTLWKGNSYSLKGSEMKMRVK